MSQFNGTHTSVEQTNAELRKHIQLLHPANNAAKRASAYSFRAANEPAFFISSQQVLKPSAAGALLRFELGQQYAGHTDAPIHAVLYENEDVNAVFHFCSSNVLVLANAHQYEGLIALSGYEMLQWLPHYDQQKQSLYIPVFAGQLHSPELAKEINRFVRHNHHLQALMVAGKGLYTWGESIAEAYAKVQLFEFLFDCEIKRRCLEMAHN